MIAAVWGVEFVPLSPTLQATGTGGCQTGDPCTDLGNVLSRLCCCFSLALFNALGFRFTSLVVYHLFTTF